MVKWPCLLLAILLGLLGCKGKGRQAISDVVTDPPSGWTLTEGGDGFLNIQPFNLSLWVNAVAEGGSCVQKRRDGQLLLVKDPPAFAGTVCGQIEMDAQQSGAIIDLRFRVEVFAGLPFPVLSLDTPLDFTHDWKRLCWDATRVFQLFGGVDWRPVPVFQCGTLPDTDRTRILGYTGCGVTFVDLSNGLHTIRRGPWSGFTGTADVLVNEVNDNSFGPGWVMGSGPYTCGGPSRVTPGLYTATDRVTLVK